MIEKVFGKAGRALHYKEVLRLLSEEENYSLGGKNPVANLTAKLSGSGRFTKVGKGTYQLSEKTKSGNGINMEK